MQRCKSGRRLCQLFPAPAFGPGTLKSIGIDLDINQARIDPVQILWTKTATGE